MVSGRTQDGEQMTIRRLPAIKSQSSISIPTAYHYYYPPVGGEGFHPSAAISVAAPFEVGGVVSREQQTQQPRRRPLGPGHYQRTLSSSSLLTNKASVSKSRSDYCGVGRGPPSPQNFRERPIVGSGSSSNIVYIDRGLNGLELGGNYGLGGGCSTNFGGVGLPSSSTTSGNNGREFRERRLIRESSQPIIVHVPITAPKATATTLSRATSPPPPQYLSSLAAASSSSATCSSSSPKKKCRPKPPEFLKKLGRRKDPNEDDDNDTNSSETDVEEIKNELKPGVSSTTQRKTITGGDQTALILDEEKNSPKVVVPAHLAKYARNAPLRKVNHPLEENIFSSLIITLVAVGLALIIGIPVLFFTGTLLVVAIVLRYSLFLLHGVYSYLRFICSNRGHLSSTARSTTPPIIFPRDRLAFSNDVRWLGRRGRREAQAILQTLLVFDGSLDLGSLRHLILTRVVHAETPEGELAYPRLMQKVSPFPAGYRWELDVAFDIQNHVIAGPSYIRNEKEIQEYLSLLLTERLSLAKPLWEIRVITNYGVQKDTIAILRVHQCLADGMTLVRILSHSLADQAQMHIPQRPHFAGLSFGFNVIRSLIVGPLTFFMWLLTTFRDANLFSVPLRWGRKSWWPMWRRRRQTANDEESGGGGGGGRKQSPTNCGRRLASDVEESSAAGTNGEQVTNSSSSPLSFPRESKPTPQKKVVAMKNKGSTVTTKKCRRQQQPKKNSGGGPRRASPWNVVWSAPVSVPKVARVKQIMRSSLNDVLLTAAAGSVRSYLQKLGIPCPDDVKVVIPIDLRNDITSPKSSTKLGCKVASVLATIPSGMEGAIPRMWATRHRLDELKASADPVVAYGATTVLMNILPHPLGVALLDNITNKASLQFSNLPGPTHTLVVGGFPLKGIYPIYPPSGKIRVGISAFSYADQVHLTVVSHRSLPNAGPSLLQGITAQVDQLSKQLSQRRVPGESRRSARHSSLNNPEMTKPPTRQIHMQLQVVQEELQQLSHRLDTPKMGVVLSAGSDAGEENLHSSDDESLGGGVSMSSRSPADQAQLRTRLKTLKTEFSELIGELRRRSSIVEGVPMSFEDEECEDDYRKPRKRALSVVSMSMSRRNSIFSGRSLTTPESSGCYSSSDDDDHPSSPSHEVRMFNPNAANNMRLSSSPIRTTAV